jgi:hypothetical protein
MGATTGSGAAYPFGASKKQITVIYFPMPMCYLFFTSISMKF